MNVHGRITTHSLQIAVVTFFSFDSPKPTGVTLRCLNFYFLSDTDVIFFDRGSFRPEQPPPQTSYRASIPKSPRIDTPKVVILHSKHLTRPV